MLLSLKVLIIFKGTFINRSRRLFFPKCKIKIHATENNHNVLFLILEVYAIKMRIKLMFAKAEVKIDREENNKLTINIHVIT